MTHNTPRIIAIANNKGGVGKTTTALALSSLLSATSRVLLIDLDAQANATTTLIGPTDSQNTVFEALTSGIALPITNIRETESGCYDLVPASLKMSWLDLQLSGQVAREQSLKIALSRASLQYDYIILDCPPSLSLITQCAFTAATDILVPLSADAYSVSGLKMVINFFNMIKGMLNPSLNLLGILITQWEKNTLSKSTESALRTGFQNLLLNTKIRKNIAVGKSQAARKDLIESMPDSNAAADYKTLLEELQTR